MRKWHWKCQWGEERKYSGYKNQIFVSGLLPSCKCPPFGGLTVCVQLNQQDRPTESKGENRKKEVAETQCGLYHLHTAARHWQLRNTTTYIRCHAALKTKPKNDSGLTADIQTHQSKSVQTTSKWKHLHRLLLKRHEYAAKPYLLLY